MAQLMWRDVAAPDLSGAMNGVSSASDMILKALATAKSGVNEVDQSVSDRFNKNLMLQLTALTDPTQAKAALPGILAQAQADPRRVSGATLSAIDNRPGQLLQQATQQIQFDKLGNEWGRDQAFQKAFDAAAPEITNFRAVVAKDPTNSAAIQAALAPVTAKLTAHGVPLDKALPFLDQQTAYENGQLNQNKDLWGFGRSKIEAGRQDITYEEGRQADALTGMLRAMGDKGQQEQALNAQLQSGKISPIVYGRVRGALGFAEAPDITGSLIAAAGGGAPMVGAGGVDASRVMNYQARGAGFAAVPDSVKTLGDASTFAQKVNAAGVPSSAMGIYQIVGQTMRNVAPQVFGSNWQSVDFNAQNQDKLAQKIFEQNSGSADALRKQWTSLSPAQAQALVGKPWEQARTVIAQGESGVSPQALMQGLALNQAATAAGLIQNQSNRNANAVNTGELAQAMQSNREPIAVAQELIGDGKTPGVFKNATPDEVLNLIQKVQNRAQRQTGAPITADTAALLLKRSVRKAGVGDRIDDWFNSTQIGGNMTTDWNKIDEQLKGLKNGHFADRMVADVGQQGQQATIEYARNQFAAAQAALMQARLAASRGQAINIGQFQQAFNQAAAAYYQAQKGAQASGYSTNVVPNVPQKQILPPPPQRPTRPTPVVNRQAAVNQMIAAAAQGQKPSSLLLRQ